MIKSFTFLGQLHKVAPYDICWYPNHVVIHQCHLKWLIVKRTKNQLKRFVLVCIKTKEYEANRVMSNEKQNFFIRLERLGWVLSRFRISDDEVL